MSESEGMRTRVMIVDHHSIVRVGLKQVLEQTGEFEVVGQATNGEEAVRLVSEVLPDVVVMDVMMPKMDGVAACREIMEVAPETRVIMFTASTEDDAVVDAVSAGATGYVRKETGLGQLLTTVRDVARGEFRVPADVVQRVFASVSAGAEKMDPALAAGLTQREREIMVSFVRGMSYTQIAEERGVVPVTVRNAIYGIQSKLEVGSMQGLVLWALRNGLLDD